MELDGAGFTTAAKSKVKNETAKLGSSPELGCSGSTIVGWLAARKAEGMFSEGTDTTEATTIEALQCNLGKEEITKFVAGATGSNFDRLPTRTASMITAALIRAKSFELE